MTENCGIYLDSCCFIDMAKEAAGQSLPAERSADVWFLKQITQACRDGELDIFTSVISIAECTHADGDMSPIIRARLPAERIAGQDAFLAQDARESYDEAMREIGKRVKGGAPVPDLFLPVSK